MIEDLGFLLVDAAFDPGASGAVDLEAGVGVGGEHGGGAVVTQGADGGAVAKLGVVVFEGEVEGVVDGGGVALAAVGGGDAVGRAEEGEGLVDEVGAEVEEQAVGGAGAFFPGVGAGDGAEAVEAGGDFDDAAEGGCGEELPKGEEVAVPAAVLEGAEEFAGLGGEVDEGADVGGGGGEGLVDDDVFAGFDGGGGEGEVGGVGGADDDEVDGGVGEGFFGGAEDGGVRVGFGGGGAGALDDGGELEAGDGGDEGAVEDFAGEAVAEDRGADGCGHGFDGTGGQAGLVFGGLEWVSPGRLAHAPSGPKAPFPLGVDYGTADALPCPGQIIRRPFI